MPGRGVRDLGYNIRVNSVHPGIVTPMLDEIMDRYVELGAAPSREAARATMDSSHPMGRAGRAEEMAGAWCSWRPPRQAS